MIPKFRAKALASGEFVYGGFCIVHDGLGSGIPCIWEVRADKGIPVDDSTLGQCLGLKDKYGVELYEGDILTDEGDFLASGKHLRECNMLFRLFNSWKYL